MSAGTVAHTILHPRLVYQSPGGENERIRVPGWAHFLADTGSWIGRLDPPQGCPVTVALALPCRPYAAAFTAVGVVVGRAVDEGHRLSPAEHFRSLAALPPGTPVFWKNGDRLLKGLLQGPARHSTCDFIRVQVGNEAGGRKTHLVRKDKALSVRITEHEGNLPKDQRGRKVKGVTPFLQAWLGKDAALLVEGDRCECVIIGRRSTLKEELTQKHFLIESQEPVAGSLNEVVRARPLVTSTSNHRAQIRTYGQGAPSDVQVLESPIVVFDGSLGFLKTRPARARRHSVILLNRAEPRFDDAINVLMGTFHERGTKVDLAREGLRPPSGLEYFGFREY